MDLRAILKDISETAKTFRNGSQITIPVGAYEPVLKYLALIKIAKELGATPYEIERAAAGEFIGSSFTEECTSAEN